MAVSDIDIWRSAKLMIDQQGAAAWIFAATRVRELTDNSDPEGAAVWRRIADAIAQIDDAHLSDKPN